MPRYYFHVRVIDRTIVPDFIGAEFVDEAAAIADASQATVEKPVANFEAVLVSDETGRILATVPFGQPQTVERQKGRRTRKKPPQRSR